MTDWYEEVTLFSNKHVEPFKFSSPTGHYTALVWASTDKVGCGATSYKNGRWFSTLYTCNYGPNGNFINGQMYKKGPACSACDSGEKCSTSFPGLCGKIFFQKFFFFLSKFGLRIKQAVFPLEKYNNNCGETNQAIETNKDNKSDKEASNCA